MATGTAGWGVWGVLGSSLWCAGGEAAVLRGVGGVGGVVAFSCGGGGWDNEEEEEVEGGGGSGTPSEDGDGAEEAVHAVQVVW